MSESKSHGFFSIGSFNLLFTGVAIDGGKGLRKAVRDVFAQYEVVQRCQVHKMRNVLDQLPDAKKPSVRAALQEAHKAECYETALKLRKNLVRALAKEHPGAAASLREGLEETLTVKRLGLTGSDPRKARGRDRAMRGVARD